MEEINQVPDPKLLLELFEVKMPFGKYQGTLLYKIPVHYLEWMSRAGFPKGRLGMLLETLYVIKTNGLDGILREIELKIFKKIN